MMSRAWALVMLLLALSSIASVFATDDDSDDSLEATNVLLFLFFGLGMGILIMQVLSYCGEPVPYTVVVFLMGAIFSLTDSEHGKALHPLLPAVAAD